MGYRAQVGGGFSATDFWEEERALRENARVFWTLQFTAGLSPRLMIKDKTQLSCRCALSNETKISYCGMD